jgi:hypothetical protein
MWLRQVVHLRQRLLLWQVRLQERLWLLTVGVLVMLRLLRHPLLFRMEHQRMLQLDWRPRWLVMR